MDDDEITIEDCQQEIDSYLSKIMEYLKTGKMNMKPGQFMTTYTTIIRICDEQDKAQDLYLIYKKILQTYIKEQITSSIQMKVGDSREFLEEYVKQWRQYTIFTFSMKKMFDYLDRYFLKTSKPTDNNERMQNLVETALYYFREKIFEKRKSEYVKAILSEIQKDRENEMVDQNLIK